MYLREFCFLLRKGVEMLIFPSLALGLIANICSTKVTFPTLRLTQNVPDTVSISKYTPKEKRRFDALNEWSSV